MRSQQITLTVIDLDKTRLSRQGSLTNPLCWKGNVVSRKSDLILS